MNPSKITDTIWFNLFFALLALVGILISILELISDTEKGNPLVSLIIWMGVLTFFVIKIYLNSKQD